MAKFNMFDLLGEQDKTQPVQMKNKAEEKGEGGFPIEYISIHLIDPSEKNFYSTKDIESLADSINEHGLLQNFVVKPAEDGRYRVVAGHRRRLASLLLVERGRDDLEYVPCKVERSVDDIDEELMLITTNKENRRPTGWELVMEAERVRVLLEAKRQKQREEAQAARVKGAVPEDAPTGRIRDEIAKTLNTSSGQVGRLEAISRHLIPELMEELKAERLALNTAYELAGMSEEQQRSMLAQHRQMEGGLGIPDVKREKATATENPPPVTTFSPPRTTPQPPATAQHTPASASPPAPSSKPQPLEPSSGCQAPKNDDLLVLSLEKMILEAIEQNDIRLISLTDNTASILLPYDTAEYAVDLVGDTAVELLSVFKEEVNKLLGNMIDHLNDCLFDGEEWQ